MEKKFSGHFGTLTRYRPGCSIAPQPYRLLCALRGYIHLKINHYCSRGTREYFLTLALHCPVAKTDFNLSEKDPLLLVCFIMMLNTW
jgi:hypothetical protein